MADLTPKQAAFAREYLTDRNGKQAAIRAGYAKGASAEVTASKLLRHPGVKALIDAGTEKHAKATGVTAERVILELARVAFSDLRTVYDAHGALKAPAEWDDESAASMAGVEAVEEFAGKGDSRESIGFVKKVKRWDKVRALELLGKHLKLFTEKVDVNVKGLPREERVKRIADLVLAALARKKKGKA